MLHLSIIFIWTSLSVELWYDRFAPLRLRKPLQPEWKVCPYCRQPSNAPGLPFFGLIFIRML
jgi:hypothetical protein